MSMVPKMIGLTSTAVAAARSLSSSAATMSSLALPCVNFAIPSPTNSTGMQRHQQYAIILITLKTWILRDYCTSSTFITFQISNPNRKCTSQHLVGTSNQGPEHSLQIGGLSSSSDTSRISRKMRTNQWEYECCIVWYKLLSKIKMCI